MTATVVPNKPVTEARLMGDLTIYVNEMLAGRFDNLMTWLHRQEKPILLFEESDLVVPGVGNLLPEWGEGIKKSQIQISADDGLCIVANLGGQAQEVLSLGHAVYLKEWLDVSGITVKDAWNGREQLVAALKKPVEEFCRQHGI